MIEPIAGRYLDAVAFDDGCGGARQPRCDAYDKPYQTSCDDIAFARPCDDGFTCVDGRDLIVGGALCIANCETDDDCTHDIESCQDGVCLLKEMF